MAGQPAAAVAVAAAVRLTSLQTLPPMPNGGERNSVEQRVLLVTPTRRDGEITSGFLTAAGLPCLVCSGLPQLAAEMSSGAGAVLLTEDAIASEGIRQV